MKLNSHANVHANALASSAAIYGAIANYGTTIPLDPNRSPSACDNVKNKKMDYCWRP